MSDGWIKLHRSIRDHWIWQDPQKLRAWLDILQEVNHDARKVNIGNQIIEVKRGQSVHSLDGWAKRWGWNKSHVRRFFALLKTDTMIDTASVHVSTLVTVCNYDKYQIRRHANGTQAARRRHANGTHPTPNKNKNKNKSFPKKENHPDYKNNQDVSTCVDAPTPVEAELLAISELPDKTELPVDDRKALRDFTATLKLLWNSLPPAFPRLRDITPGRKAKIAVRFTEAEFRDRIEEIVRKIGASSFCAGESGWVAGFDWLIKNEGNYTKVLDGNYDDDKKTNGRIHGNRNGRTFEPDLERAVNQVKAGIVDPSQPALDES